LQRTAQEINAIAGRVSGALGALDWEARQKAGVDAQVNDARRRAAALASQAETMARYLMNKAQAFEEADKAGVAAVSGVATTWQSWQENYRAASPELDSVRNSQWWQQISRSGWHTRFLELDRLKAEIEQNDLACASPLQCIRDLNNRIEALKAQREQLQKHARSPLNQIIPEWPLRGDTDGVPWRVLADSDEDRIAQLDIEIQRLSELKQKYAQYYLLDDLIKQGIPEDGPSKPKSLYGCTYYAATRRNVDSWHTWGHGAEWVKNAQEAGWETGQMAVKGALVSFQPGVSYYDEASGRNIPLDPTYGHVAYVEEVDWSRSDVVRIKISEGNNTGEVGPGNVRKNCWIIIDKDKIRQGDVTFIYGPARLPPEQQMYMA
jgi:surface antigen